MMKKTTLFFLLLLSFVFGYGQMNDLIISEYGEGSSFNKYLEIFNGTGSDVDLTDYEIWRIVNGNPTWPEFSTGLSGTLSNGDVFIVAHPSASASVLAVADLVTGIAIWTGDDATGLAKDNGSGTFVLIDAIGTNGADPGTGWDVAGTTNATQNHTLVRKSSICSTNTNWTSSAGTTVNDSEWVVLPQDDWTDIGTHTTTCCIFTSTWTAGAWSQGPGAPPIPDLNTSVIIDDNYSVTAGNSIESCSLIVNSGRILTVGNGSFVEVQNDVVVDGTLLVESSGNFVQNDDAGTFTNNGTSSVNKITPPKAGWFYYTYWSSPVVGETVEDAFPNVDGDRRFWFNAANFVDNNGDDVDDNGDDWQYALTGTVMTPGVGYASTEARLFFPGATGQATFEGAFNTGDIDVTITSNPTNTGVNWNFIGNPYPSAIDFDAFYAANSGVVQGTAYFWSQGSPLDAGNAGNQQFNFDLNDYAVYAAGAGAGTGSGGGGITPNGSVPSGQGFFIAQQADGTATFTNAMRMADGTSNSQFFKTSNAKKATSNANRIWIDLTNEVGFFNQIALAYVENATSGNDGMTYDAPKLLTSNFAMALYSIIDADDSKYAIQAKNISDLNEDEIIKIGLNTNINVSTEYTFSISKLEGDFVSNNTIYLIDNLTNTSHNLSYSAYTFTSEAGEFNDRFEIVFNENALSKPEFELSNKVTILQFNDNQFQFTSDSSRFKSIEIFDLLGRPLYKFEGNSTNETYDLSSLKRTVYIANIALDNGKTTSIKFIKN